MGTLSELKLPYIMVHGCVLGLEAQTGRDKRQLVRKLWKAGSTSKQSLNDLCPHFVERRALSRVCTHGANHHHARCEGTVAKISGHHSLGFAERRHAV